MHVEQYTTSASPIPEASAALTMGSDSIGDLVGARHDSVKRTIDRLAEKGIVTFTPMVEKSSGGRPGTVYHVNKRDSFIIVAQLCPEFTARLVDRWQELEGIVAAQPSSAIDVRNPQQLALIASQLIEVNQEQAKQIEAMQETVQAHDRLCESEGSLCITDAAKTLGIRRKDMFNWLHDKGWIFKRGDSDDWVAYAPRLASGVMEHRVATYTRPDGTEKVVTQARVTPKGLSALAKLITPTAKLIGGRAQ